jgi:hypothetical protein
LLGRVLLPQAFQRGFHRRHAVIHHALDHGHQPVRQEVGNPDDSAPRAFGKHLERRVMMRRPPFHDRIGEPAPRIIDVDDPFPCDNAVGERDKACVAFELRAVTTPRASRVWTAPTSRNAAQTWSGAASTNISLWIEAMVIS